MTEGGGKECRQEHQAAAPALPAAAAEHNRGVVEAPDAGQDHVAQGRDHGGQDQDVSESPYPIGQHSCRSIVSMICWACPPRHLEVARGPVLRLAIENS